MGWTMKIKTKKAKFKSLGFNHNPGSISWLAGWSRPKPDCGYQMVFSLKKAKEIAKSIGLKNITSIVGGLDGDFTENSQVIYDGVWKTPDFYQTSCWATPIIQVEMKDGVETFECWEK